MDTLNCRADKEKITVGEHVHLTCSGNINPDFSVEKSGFKLEEAGKYNLKVFTTKTGSNKLNLDFTIYAPGDYKISDLILTDGMNEINLNGAGIKVESVIQPTQDGKQPEPFGSILPISISTPVYYYILFAAFLLAAIGYTVFKIKRISYYKKLKEKLKHYNSPIDPDVQFYKAIRAAEKLDYPLDQIEQSFRLYNLRAYQLPMFELSNERILRYFKRNFPQHKATRAQLVKLIDELHEMQKRKDQLTFSEKQDFVKKLYRYVDTNRGLHQ